MPTLTPLHREMLKALALSGALSLIIIGAALSKPTDLLDYLGAIVAGLLGAGFMSILFAGYMNPSRPRTPEQDLREKASRRVIPIIGAITGVLLYRIYT